MKVDGSGQNGVHIGIEKLNQKIMKCRKCRLFETRANALSGEGNLKANVMLIAQAPGENENIEGRMFIGPSGKILDGFLKIADIQRKEIYMTNLIKCMLPKNRKPKRDEIETCSEYLDAEIELINPSALVPLGYHSAGYIFRKHAVQLPVKPEFHTACGKIFKLGGRKILPLQHPAAVLYNSSIREAVEINYSKIKVVAADCKWYPACPMKWYYDEGKLDDRWIETYCKGDWERCVRFQMEEKGIVHPDWMLPDGSIDERLR